MRWCVEYGTVSEEKLEPLGLICYGGGYNKNGTTYHVFNEDKSFDVEVNQKDFDNIDKIYHQFKTKDRKEKLEKINKNV